MPALPIAPVTIFYAAAGYGPGSQGFGWRRPVYVSLFVGGPSGGEFCAITTKTAIDLSITLTGVEICLFLSVNGV
ncbi:MAG: hypothetical protein ACREE6_17585 [Limisphaerales bacterium]